MIRTITKSLSGRMIIALILMLFVGLAMSAIYLNQTMGDLRRTVAHAEAHRLVNNNTSSDDLNALPLHDFYGEVDYTLFTPNGKPLWHSSNLTHARRFKPSIISSDWYSHLFHNIGNNVSVPVTLSDGNIIMVAFNDKYLRTILEPLIEQKIIRAFWLTIPICLIFCSLLIPLLIRWTLKSVHAACDVAEKISPDGNVKSIPTDDLPIDIQPLANAANSALQKLDKAYCAERRFVADAAHSLRTPLAIISLSMDDLKKGKYSAVALVEKETRRLEQLVSQLLQLARIEHDGDNAALDQRVQISRCLRHACALQLPLFEEANRELRITIPQELEYVTASGSEHLFSEVFNNLIENALLHGTGLVEVSIGVDNDIMNVHVRDEGKLLHAMSLDTLSTRFYKGIHDSEGSGLGLSIVRSILPHLSATLALDTTCSTRFTLSFTARNTRTHSQAS